MEGGPTDPAALCSPDQPAPTDLPGSPDQPAPTDLPGAWATTATLATGRGTVTARVDGVIARARNQLVEPSGVVSPIWIPAAAACRASASGTSTRDTSLVLPRYQVTR